MIVTERCLAMLLQRFRRERLALGGKRHLPTELDDLALGSLLLTERCTKNSSFEGGQRRPPHPQHPDFTSGAGLRARRSSAPAPAETPRFYQWGGPPCPPFRRWAETPAPPATPRVYQW